MGSAIIWTKGPLSRLVPPCGREALRRSVTASPTDCLWYVCFILSNVRRDSRDLPSRMILAGNKNEFVGDSSIQALACARGPLTLRELHRLQALGRLFRAAHTRCPRPVLLRWRSGLSLSYRRLRVSYSSNGPETIPIASIPLEILRRRYEPSLSSSLPCSGRATCLCLGPCRK